MELDREGKNLLELLVQRLDSAIPGSPNTYIGYKECHDFLRLEKVREKWGESLKQQGLISLANWTVQNRLPAITGLIVDRTTSEPGYGYFTLHGTQMNPYSWWETEIRRSKAHNWSPFLTPEFSLMPVDLNSPARSDIKISRIIRDTGLSLLVKRINNYSCQICGLSIDLPQDRKYVEAHHIKPLGEPHNGPDVLENLICVCPNHHAMLDYAAISLDLSQIKIVDGHQISLEYIDYHNREICRGKN